MENDVAFAIISSDAAAERSLRCFTKRVFPHENEQKHPLQGKGYSEFANTLLEKLLSARESLSVKKDSINSYMYPLAE